MNEAGRIIIVKHDEDSSTDVPAWKKWIYRMEEMGEEWSSFFSLTEYIVELDESCLSRLELEDGNEGRFGLESR